MKLDVQVHAATVNLLINSVCKQLSCILGQIRKILFAKYQCICFKKHYTARINASVEKQQEVSKNAYTQQSSKIFEGFTRTFFGPQKLQIYLAQRSEGAILAKRKKKDPIGRLSVSQDTHLLTGYILFLIFHWMAYIFD